MMDNWKRQIKRFAQEEDGQTTTEYILMLVVVVTIFVKFKDKFNGVITKLFSGLDAKTDEALDE